MTIHEARDALLFALDGSRPHAAQDNADIMLAIDQLIRAHLSERAQSTPDPFPIAPQDSEET